MARALPPMIQQARDQMDAQLWGKIAEDLARQAEEEYIQRQQDIQERWDAYWGKYPDSQKHNKDGVDYNIFLNLSRTIVDKGVSFLFGQGLQIEVDEDDDTDNESTSSPSSTYLSRFWGDDKSFDRGRKTASKEVLLQRLAMNGALGGHCFVKLQPRQDESENMAGVSGNESLPPDIEILDPKNMWVDLVQGRVNEVQQYTYTWADIDPTTGRGTIYRQRTRREDDDTWLIIDDVLRGSTWTLLEQTTWNYPWAPITDCQNLPMPNDFWGVSDLERDVLALNYAINRSASDLNKIMALYAFPVGFGKMIGAQHTAGLAGGKLVIGENPNSDMKYVEMASQGDFPLGVFDRFTQLLHEITEIPEVASGKLENVGPLSGAALSILYGPLVDKTTKKRGLYGDLIEELSVHALVIGGYPGVDVNLTWPDIIPQDSQDMATQVSAMSDMGVSNDTMIKHFTSFDPQEEAQKMSNQHQEAMDRFNAGMSPDQGAQSNRVDPNIAGSQPIG